MSPAEDQTKQTLSDLRAAADAAGVHGRHSVRTASPFDGGSRSLASPRSRLHRLKNK